MEDKTGNGNRRSEKTAYEVYASLYTALYCMGEILPAQERERAGSLMEEISSESGSIYLVGEQFSGKTRMLRWLLDGSGETEREQASRIVEETYENGREQLSYREIGVRDTVIFVIRATQPFGMSEQRKLADLLREGRMYRILFLVNMMNLVEEEEQEELLDYLKDRVARAMDEIAREESSARQEDLRAIRDTVQWAVYRRRDEETIRRLRKNLFLKTEVPPEHIRSQARLLLEEWKAQLEERMERHRERMSRYRAQAEEAHEHGRLLQRVWEHELMQEKKSPLADFFEERLEECLWQFEERFVVRMTEGIPEVIQNEMNQIADRIRGQWEGKVRGDFARILEKKSWSQAIELRMVEMPDRKLAAGAVSQILEAAEKQLRENLDRTVAWIRDIADQAQKECQWKISHLPDFDSDCETMLSLSELTIPLLEPSVPPKEKDLTEIVPRADELQNCQEIRRFTDQAAECVRAYCEGQQAYKKRLLELVAEKKKRKETDLQTVLLEAEEPRFFWGEIQEVDWSGRLSYEIRMPGDRIFGMSAEEWLEADRHRDLLRGIGAMLKREAASRFKEWSDLIDREYAGLLQRRMLGRTELLLELNRRVENCHMESWRKEKRELERIEAGLGACAGIYAAAIRG